MDYLVYNVNKLTKEEYNSFYKETSDYVKCKIDKRLKAKDKKLTLMGYILVNKLLKENYDINIEEIVIKESSFNKPYIENIPSIYFNISHCNNYVISAVSYKEIGIDISYIKEVSLNTINQFCTLKEIELIKNSNNKMYNLFKMWAMKESYFKALSNVDIKEIEIHNQKEVKFTIINDIKNYIICICEKI